MQTLRINFIVLILTFIPYGFIVQICWQLFEFKLKIIKIIKFLLNYFDQTTIYYLISLLGLNESPPQKCNIIYKSPSKKIKIAAIHPTTSLLLPQLK